MISKSKKMLYKLSAVMILATGFTFLAIPPVNTEAAWCVERGDPGGDPFWADECTPPQLLQSGGSGTRWVATCTNPNPEVDIDVTPNVTVQSSERRILVFCAGTGGNNNSITRRNPSTQSAPGTYFTAVCSSGESAFPSPNPTATVSNTDLVACANDDRIELRSVSSVEPEPDTPVEPDPGGGSSGGGDFALENPGEDERQLENTPVVLGCSDTTATGGTVIEGTDSPILCEFIRVVRFLSIGVTIVAAITVAVSGLQYTAAKGDPNKTSQAVQRLAKVGMGIVFYLFGWALLEFLIPGGALG